MDLLLKDYDLDITDGDLTFVRGAEAITQDVRMRLRTWLGETPYDVSAGVPYLQVIFERGVELDAVRFILENRILDTPGVEQVTELDVELNPRTRVANVTGRALIVGDVEIDFSTLIGQDAPFTQ